MLFVGQSRLQNSNTLLPIQQTEEQAGSAFTSTGGQHGRDGRSVPMPLIV